jgi:hypothetical protein
MHKKVLCMLLILLVGAPLARPDKADKGYAEFTFARVRFNMYSEGYRRGEEPWHHDYPKSEDFFLSMVMGVTGVHTNPEAYEIVDLDSDDIFRFPFLYVSEPGFMDLTEDEMKNLREYFARGGFVMFDDFRGRHLDNLALQLKRIMPERELVQLELKHTVFRSFYEIDTLDMPPPYINPGESNPTVSFWGMHDEDGRLILAANADNDFGEYWEDIDNGAVVLQPAVQAFRFGVNYLIYAMTH